jgi:hypothetical protein
MSAAATAAGYLYASGRLRGKGKEVDHETPSSAPERKRLRIAAIRSQEPEREPAAQVPETPARPKRVPRVEYRVRRRVAAE